VAKRIYTATVKKWLITGGIATGIIIAGIFTYLSFLGVIDISDFSGDMVCAGTIEDPCYAYINFTVKEDVFIYPVDYDPWGRDTIFDFDPAVESWKLQRSWGSGWRNIPLDKSCTGTWCGLSNKDDTRKFSIAFREGREYQIRIVAYKKDPNDLIKWGVYHEDKEVIDPVWLPFQDMFTECWGYNRVGQNSHLIYCSQTATRELETKLTAKFSMGVRDYKVSEIVTTRKQREVLDIPKNSKEGQYVSKTESYKDIKEVPLDTFKSLNSHSYSLTSAQPYMEDETKIFKIEWEDKDISYVQPVDHGGLVSFPSKNIYTNTMTINPETSYNYSVNNWAGTFVNTTIDSDGRIRLTLNASYYEGLEKFNEETDFELRMLTEGDAEYGQAGLKVKINTGTSKLVSATVMNWTEGSAPEEGHTWDDYRCYLRNESLNEYYVTELVMSPAGTCPFDYTVQEGVTYYITVGISGNAPFYAQYAGDQSYPLQWDGIDVVSGYNSETGGDVDMFQIFGKVVLERINDSFDNIGNFTSSGYCKNYPNLYDWGIIDYGQVDNNSNTYIGMEVGFTNDNSTPTEWISVTEQTDMNNISACFFYRPNITSKDGYESAKLNEVNATYLSTIPPALYITKPVNNSYLSDFTTELEVTVHDVDGVDSVWYSINYGGNTTIDPPLGNTTFSRSEGTYLLQVFANDTSGLENQTEANFSVIPAEIDFYLDGLDIDRTYEYETYANLTAISNVEEPICISLDAPGYSADVCGDGVVNISYLVGDFRSKNWSLYNYETIDFSSTNPGHVNITIKENVTINTLNFNISGILSSGYPTNLVCDLANDGVIDLSFPGNLSGNTIHQMQNHLGYTTDSLLYATAGTNIIYINLSSSSALVRTIQDGWLNLSGGVVNSEGYDEIDYYWNSSHINADSPENSTVNNQFTWEDFSLGDITGRWGGGYTITTDTNIHVISDSAVYCSSSTSSDSDNFYSQTLDMTRFGSVFMKVYVRGTAGTSADNTDTYCPSASSSGTFQLKDKTTGSTTSIKSASAAAGGCSACYSSSDSSSDTSTWEFRKDGTQIKVYNDGVYSQSIDYDASHQYEVRIVTSTSATGDTCTGYCSPDGGAVAQAHGYIYWVNATGLTGEKIGDFTWGNSTVTSKDMAEFSTDIISATLTATESKPSGTNIEYFLSPDGGQNWESVINGLAHTFSNTGTFLQYRANLTSTYAQDAGGDLDEQPIVYDLRLQVINGTAENISIDVGADGSFEWHWNNSLSETNSTIGMINATAIRDYMNENCLITNDCLIPIAIKTMGAGRIIYDGIDQNITINGISINELTNVTNYLIGNTTVPIYCGSLSSNGIANFTDLDARYRSEENVTVTAYYARNVSNNVTQTITIRYSDYEINLPNDLDMWEVYPSAFTSFNNTPYSQVIETYMNISTPIFNITSLAEKDPFNLVVRLNHSTSTCINMTLANDIIKSRGIIANLSDQLVMSNLTTSNHTGIFMWVDLNECDSSGVRYWDPMLIWNAYCQDCVFPTDIDGV